MFMKEIMRYAQTRHTNNYQNTNNSLTLQSFHNHDHDMFPNRLFANRQARIKL